MMTTASQTRSKSEMGHSRPKEPALPASRCPLLSKSDLIVSRTRNDANGHEETHAPQQNGCLFFLPKGTSSSLRKAVIGNADLYSYSRQKMQIALARYPRFSSRLSLDASENEHSDLQSIDQSPPSRYPWTYNRCCGLSRAPCH